MSDLIISTPSMPPALVEGIEAARDYAAQNRADSTRVGYLADWRAFERWCVANGLEAMPATAAVVGTYAATEARRGIRPVTIARRLAAIAFQHLESGYPSPTADQAVKDILSGIRRANGTAPVARKAAATADKITVALDAIPATPTGLRDRAMLAIGFAAAMRRSELVSLNREDIEDVREGILVHIRSSKTDQQGAGYAVAVPHGHTIRPVAALLEWIASAGIETGPLFRQIRKGGSVTGDRLTGRSVANIVKDRLSAVGIDATDFSAHSLRAGFVTSAAEAGESVFRIKSVSRHKSMEVLSGYVRSAEQFKAHAGRKFL